MPEDINKTENDPSVAIIGGADGPTSIYISGDPLIAFIIPTAMFVGGIILVYFIVKRR